MIEYQGNLFEQWDANAICITTNGFRKQDGTAVMGAGTAKQASERWSWLPKRLGGGLKQHGNCVQLLTSDVCREKYGLDYHIISFPVKPVNVIVNDIKNNVVGHMRGRCNPGNEIPGWAAVADMDIITRSAHQLVEMTNYYSWTKVCLPRPGCGAGELSWSVVKQALEPILDNRFVVVQL